MAKNPILPLYYNDIDRSTRTWSDEEFGAYMRLLIEQWDKGYLPNDYQKLTRLSTSLDRNWKFLKDKFPEVDGVLKNPVMEEIRAKRNKFSEKQKNNVQKRYQTDYQNTFQKVTKTPSKKLPLENEYEIENEYRDKEGGVGETLRGKSKEVFEGLCEYFGVTEMKFNLYRELDRFVTVLTSTGHLDEFVNQFKAYNDYKRLADEKKHNMKGFIGTAEKLYQDGGWASENWEHKLLNFKPNGQQEQKQRVDDAERLRASIVDKLRSNRG